MYSQKLKKVIPFFSPGMNYGDVIYMHSPASTLNL